ncbi:apoptosis-inducing factor 2 [Fusarium albosuccineum]|uniref:Apoptosis-inducing factor 2 n=1 Tax=Fusarium albosuccineum TaxID=1237068 RepID=A0A8H4LGT5_9HYPO|nr:apoptosis-inducing factor 2 [Fusarium albosuccineum]
MTADVKTIVVLGAGPAALPIIRQTMVNQVLKRKDLKIVVVSPNTHFHWPIAMPRAVVPGQLVDDKVLISFEPTFKDYPADKFEWIQGKAVSLDPTSNLVGVELNGSAAVREVNYHTLIIATGSRTKDDGIWKSLATTKETKDKLHQIQDQISKAKTIVVAGGGMTGSETAGELGFEYSQHGKKEVIFVYSDKLPLAPPATDQVRKQAKKELEKLKVHLIPNSTVTSVTPKPGSSDLTLELRGTDGTTKTITAQAYLPATGIVPNTEFVPKALLDSHNFIKQTTRLQVEGHKNIFVIGDAGNLEQSKLMFAEGQSRHLLKALPVYIDGGEVPEYTVNPKEIFAVTLGRSRATGQMGTMKLFSILVWWMKGRYLGTDYAGGWAAGKRTMSVTFEK